MRADRLLTILLYLQARGRGTSRELAEKLEVSTRTIHRDMDALSAAGVPVFAERGVRGGWRLAEGYRTNLTGMTRDEIMSLMIHMRAGPADTLATAKELDSAFLKLAASLPEGHRNEMRRARESLHVDPEGWSGAKTPKEISFLRRAIWEQKEIRFQYMKADGGGERRARPLGLVSKQAKWYLAADTDKGTRVYLVARIKNPEATGRAFERPPGFDLAAYWEKHTAEFKAGFSSYPVRLSIRENRLLRLRAIPFVKLVSISEPRDGRVIVEADLERKEMALAVLPGFGAAAEVLSPGDLRSALHDLGQELQELYS